MPSSLDMPKKPRNTAPRRKKNEGRPDGITKVLAEFRFERVTRDPQSLEREIRTVAGSMLIYRTAETPLGDRKEEGTVGSAEFVIMDDQGKHVEKDTAESWGKAEEYGRVFASQRGLQLVDNRIPLQTASN